MDKLNFTTTELFANFRRLAQSFPKQNWREGFHKLSVATEYSHNDTFPRPTSSLNIWNFISSCLSIPTHEIALRLRGLSSFSVSPRSIPAHDERGNWYRHEEKSTISQFIFHKVCVRFAHFLMRLYNRYVVPPGLSGQKSSLLQSRNE